MRVWAWNPLSYDITTISHIKELIKLNIHSHTLTLSPSSVGKDGFEPPNSGENRFTVCCRWPLDYLPDGCCFHVTKTNAFISENCLFCQLSLRGESNPRPADYKSAALPTELLRHDLFHKMKMTTLQRTKTDGITRLFFWEGKGKRIC